MSLRIEKWLAGKEKTIVYFPYAQNAFDASRGVRGFSGIKTDPRIGVFTGKNVDELNTETFNEKKRETFNKFRTGEQPVIYATKAFGMGVDIDDVKMYIITLFLGIFVIIFRKLVELREDQT